MSGNPNYNYNAPDFTAVTTGHVLKNKFRDQVFLKNPLLAAIHGKEDGKGKKTNWNKGGVVKDSHLLVPLAYDSAPSINGATLGQSFGEMIPTGWTNYDPINGVTQAKVPMAYFGTGYALTPMELELLNKGKRGDILDMKLNTLMSKFKQVLDDQLQGDQAGDPRRLEGMQHMLATTNTVFGINQQDGGNAWWRANCPNANTALSLSHVDHDYDHVTTRMSSQPDVILAASTTASGSVNVWGKIRSLIQANARLVNVENSAKFGLKTFEYLGMTVIPNHKGPSGSYYMLCTDNLFYFGDEVPREAPAQRIYGSAAQERYFSMWGAVIANELRNQTFRKGITG